VAGLITIGGDLSPKRRNVVASNVKQGLLVRRSYQGDLCTTVSERFGSESRALLSLGRHQMPLSFGCARNTFVKVSKLRDEMIEVLEEPCRMRLRIPLRDRSLAAAAAARALERRTGVALDAQVWQALWKH
jgi:hypothetical protein